MTKLIAYRLDRDGCMIKTDLLMIRRALDAAGYNEEPATEGALRSCFRDYVDCGAWNNVELDDIDEYSIKDICRNFIRLEKRNTLE